MILGGYIMKDEGRKKIIIDKWGFPRHPIVSYTLKLLLETTINVNVVNKYSLTVFV